MGLEAFAGLCLGLLLGLLRGASAFSNPSRTAAFASVERDFSSEMADQCVGVSMSAFSSTARQSCIRSIVRFRTGASTSDGMVSPFRPFGQGSAMANYDSDRRLGG
jgi:hypothetical protein